MKLCRTTIWLGKARRRSLTHSSPCVDKPRKEGCAMYVTENAAGQRWTALVLLAAVEFMILLDTAIVNIATPAIKAGLHLSEADLPWIQNAYLLVFGGVLLLGGRAADLFGRKRLYLIGLGLFTASSLLAGLAPTGGALPLSRRLPGGGAGLVVPTVQCRPWTM